MSENTKEEYLEKILGVYKNNPQDDSLNQVEKLLLQQAFAKENKLATLLEQMQTLKEELDNKQKQLQLLDQQVTFERGQMTGIVDSLLSLRTENE